MFKQYVINAVTPLAWWKSQSQTLDGEVMKVVIQFLSAKASSANVEPIFSTFGFVHSKVRNRLGVEKAGKLVFMYRLMNMK